jgi:OFA family oxalate/formate antiporter-like MFS transporter
VGVTGGVHYGLGVFLASFSGGSLPVLYLTYGLITGVGLGIAYIVPIQSLPKWFPKRPGLATGQLRRRFRDDDRVHRQVLR